MIDIIKLANRTIPKSPQLYHLKKTDYVTNDIIELISVAHAQAKKQTYEFAKSFPGRNLAERAKLLYDFLLINIRYKEDEPGYQFVKLPSAVWHDKFCDCKSFSLFIGGILANWNIPFVYRFTSYVQNDTLPRHVYPVIKKGNKELIMDVVYKKFDQQKKLIHKPIDLNMEPGLYYVAGIGTNNIRMDLQGRDVTDISDAEMDLLIAKDRMDTMKDIVENKRGVSGLKSEQFQDTSDMLQDAIDAVRKHSITGIGDIEQELGLIADMATSGEYSIAPSLSGLGATAKKAKRQEKKAARVVKKEKAKAEGKKGFSNLKSRTQVALKKVAKVAKKGAKAIVKVASAPLRLTAKAVLEVMLPQASLFFLYLFINDPAIIAKLPEPIKKKRAKEERIANFIINTIGMKRPHFMGIVRNGIMKQTGKSPETLLFDMFGSKVAGIGFVGAAATAAFAIIKKGAPYIIKLMKFIFSKLGKKHSEDVTENDNPSADDFLTAGESSGGNLKSEQQQDEQQGEQQGEGAPEKEGLLKRLATAIKNQDANQEIINNPDADGSGGSAGGATGGGGFWNTMK